MAAVPTFLSLDAFEAQYGDRKPYHEYWFGEAFEKTVPTILHSVVQHFVVQLLLLRGYFATGEARLKISKVAQPIPDVIANPTLVTLPYPTEPFEVAVEILSPGDDLKRTFTKGAHYLDWKISFVWIIDPEKRIAFQMSQADPVPHAATELTASQQLKPIALAELWAEVDRLLAKQPVL